jgi:predicted 3-demethylubiquinone-9 3-methyltransferase (glyoxalase superfamily)
VSCETQAEVDELWEKLTDGGEESQCGWLKDKFGVAWQIIPTALGELMGDPDPEKSKRVMQAMLQMHKIDVEKLKQAYEGR